MTTASKFARALVFIVLAVAVSALLNSPGVEVAALVPLRSAIAAAAAGLFNAAGAEAQLEGAVVHLARGSVEIVDSCTGLDVWLILVCAMAVFPATLRSRVVGAGLAAVVVFGANFARVLVLCSLVGAQPALFEVIHGYAWPVVMIAACLGVAIYWMQNIALADSGAASP